MALFPPLAAAEPFKEAFPEVYSAVDPAAQAHLDKLDLKHGTVALGEGYAQVALSEGYYFLDPAASKVVLEELWGNPPGIPPLGMIFPAGSSPLHDSWGLTIDYDPMGYVSDEDAASYDYDALLADMKRDLIEENKARAKDGFERIDLIGWAEPPHYDATARELYWAKQLHFGTSTGDTLNYNIRELGRHGVLVVNFIAGMDQLPAVRDAVPEVRQMISFTDGNRYADFVPGVDTVAAVGIGGLIAGKVAAKAGLLVVLLAFLKKGAFLILLPIAWVISKLRGSKGSA
ncbi:MAG: DUF2167 domain-containing protein [Paracoccaceae bacterium]